MDSGKHPRMPDELPCARINTSWLAPFLRVHVWASQPSLFISLGIHEHVGAAGPSIEHQGAISSWRLERSAAWANPPEVGFWGPERMRRCESHARRAAGSVPGIVRSGALHLRRLVLECTIGVRSFLYSCSLWLRLCPEPSLGRSLKLWGV